MLLVAACVLGVVFSMAAYYDTNLRSGLENKAKTTTDFFSNYISQSYILGMDFSIGSCLQVLVAGTMAGIMFSMIAIESGSVWNSGIVHAIWNIVMIGGGLAIGQKADQFSVMTYVLDAKSFAVTGGEFGMEASVISLVGYIIVTGVAFFGNKELCDIIYKKE
mgnify:CR=1 FL=1